MTVGWPDFSGTFFYDDKSSELSLLCMSGFVQRLFIVDNGRTIFRRIELNQTMGNHFPPRAAPGADEIDSKASHDNGLSKPSHAPSVVAEDKIY